MKPLVIFLLLVFSQKIFSQIKNPFNVAYKYINLKNEMYNGKEKFDFSGIEILDARNDSSKVGFLINGIIPELYRLNYQNGLTTDVTDYLSAYYTNAFTENNNKVLIVVKKLWVSQFDTTLKVGSGLIYSGNIYSVNLKLEFYLKNESNYYPITRIDSSFFTTQRNSAKAFGIEIIDGLINCCDKLFSINTSLIKQRKKYTIDQVKQFNKLALDKPILQTNQYKKGVYATFSEFLNNAPSVTYSGIDQQKFGDVLYLNDGKGGEYASNKFWGYCDGENIYIISARNFFRLVRTQNTFEFYGIKNLRERYNYRNDIIHQRKPALDMFVYQVDMETGEVY